MRSVIAFFSVGQYFLKKLVLEDIVVGIIIDFREVNKLFLEQLGSRLHICTLSLIKLYQNVILLPGKLAFASKFDLSDKRFVEGSTFIRIEAKFLYDEVNGNHSLFVRHIVIKDRAEV